MAYVYYVVGFDGYRWKPFGSDQWVTEAGASREVDRLKRRFPTYRWQVRRARPTALSRLVQHVA